ncbi:sugar transporter ERD6-like 4 isoform X2 [Portunus trituberculatus]|nr:sugar transporter ERD6-like 4 isoform X2 [Portunus trituberculatus]
MSSVKCPEGDSGAAERRVRGKHVIFMMVVALTSILQGTVTKGWTAVLPKMQDDPHSFVNTDSDVAWLVSMTSVVGILASLATGPLVEWAGPRRLLAIAMAVSTGLWLLMVFPPNKVVFFAARAGLAACAYVISTISLPLLAEMSPNNVRGSVSTLSEVGGSTGVLYGYLVAFLFPWKIATGLCTLTAALLFLPLWLVPESPYWLVRRGRLDDAKASLQRLMGSKAAKAVEEEMEAITNRPTATQTSLLQQEARSPWQSYSSLIMTVDSSPKAAAGSVSVKQLAMVTVVGFCSLTQGTATKGWTAVVPKMEENPHNFVITENDVAWLVSMTSIIGIFASLATGPLVEWLGPRRVMSIAMGLCIVFWLGLAFPPNKPLLYVTRAGLSVCVYIIVTILNPLVAELSPHKFRGLAGSFTEISGALGALVGYLLAFLAPWEVATALCTLTAAVVFLPLLFVTESPYWLVRRGRLDDAKASLQRLMGPRAEVEEELAAMTKRPSATQTSLLQQFTELRKGQNFRPVVLVLSFFVLRELGGRSCIMMYTVYIFRDAGVELDAFTCTVLVGVARLVCTCVTAAVLDHVGRRPLLISTAVVASVSQSVCGLFLFLQLPGASMVPLVAVLVYIAAYGTGVGPIPWVYVGELVPSPVRSLGASIITACDAFVVFSINLAFLRIIDAIGLATTFSIFAVLNFLIGVLVCLWIPETRGVPLQELDDVFSLKKTPSQNSQDKPGETTEERLSDL